MHCMIAGKPGSAESAQSAFGQSKVWREGHEEGRHAYIQHAQTIRELRSIHIEGTGHSRSMLI